MEVIVLENGIDLEEVAGPLGCCGGTIAPIRGGS